MVNQVLTHTIIVWLCYQLSEAFLMVYCGPRLLGLHPTFKQVGLSALGLGILVPMSRAVVPLGLHTPLLFAAYVLIAAFVMQISLASAAVSAAISFFLLSVGESAVLVPVMTAAKWSMADILKSTPLHIAAGYISSSLLLVVALLVSVFRFRLLEVPEARSERG